MKLFGYEFRKITGIRYFTILLVLLMIGSGVLCYFTVRGQGVRKFGAHAVDEINDIMKEYAGKPEELDQLIDFLVQKTSQNLMEVLDRWEKEKQESGLGDAYPPLDFEKNPELLYTYNYSEVLPDGIISACLLNERRNTEKFNSELQIILEQAKINAQRLEEDYGMDVNDYLYYYQVYVYDQYSYVLKNASVGSCYVSGWDQLFFYTYGDIFLFAGLILLCCVVFVPEKQCGMLPVLRATRRGRTQTGWAKISVLLLCSALIALIFAAIHYFVIYFVCGYSDPSVSVQNVSSMDLFPKVWTVGQYFAYSVLLKVLAAMCFSAIVGFLSALTYSPILSYLGGAVLFGASFAMSRLNAMDHPFLHCLNLFSVENVSPLSDRLNVARFFNGCINYLTLAPLLCFAGILLFALPTVVLSSSVRVRSRSKARVSLFVRIKTRLTAWGNAWQTRMRQRAEASGKRSKKPKNYGMGLGFWEGNKLLFRNIPLLALVAVLIVLQIVVSIRGADYGTLPREYRIYTAFLVSEAKGSFSEQGEKYSDLLEMYKDPVYAPDQLRRAYEQGDIDKEAYDRIKEYLNTIRKNIGPSEFRMAENHYKDFEEQQVPKGLDPWFIDYLGWSRLFATGISYPLYAAILIVCIFAFIVEYGGKSKNDHFANILRSTKYGRKKTFRAKCLTVTGISFLFALLFWGVEYLCIFLNGTFPDIHAPLCSIPNFAQVSSGITIFQYLLFSLAAKLLAAVLTGLFVTAVSALTRNIFSGLTVSVAVTMIPSLLYALGMKGAGYASFSAWFGVNEMMIFSMEKDLFGWDFGVYALYTGAFAAVTAVLLFAARKKFIK